MEEAGKNGPNRRKAMSKTLRLPRVRNRGERVKQSKTTQCLLEAFGEESSFF